MATRPPLPVDTVALSSREAADLLARSLRYLPTSASPIVILAVSGGPDSLALLRAAREARTLSCRFHVVTVDHGLRAESAAEAGFVADIAARFGLPHSVRRWGGDKPAGNPQGRARAARYGLLIEAAHDLGAAAIMTAHHQDDQIETHLLAHARKAGDRGLAGMRAVRALAPGLMLLRPFLDVPGARLKASAAGLDPVDDPSNHDLRYDRVRIRQAIGAGLVDRTSVLTAIATHAARREDEDTCLGTALGGLLRAGQLVVSSAEGRVELDPAAFEALDEAVATDLLARILTAVAGEDYPPLRRATERLRRSLLASIPGRRSAHSLGGVVSERTHATVFTREFGRQGPAMVKVVPGAHHAVFDGRFDIFWEEGAPRGAAGLVPLGRFDLGNPTQRTLPVLVDGEGRPLSAAAAILPKFAGQMPALPMRERLSWRLGADLPVVTASGTGDLSAITNASY